MEGLPPNQLLPETRSKAGAEILVPECSAKKCHERSDALTFIWSVTSCSLSTSERHGLNGRKASDWLRLYAPKMGPCPILRVEFNYRALTDETSSSLSVPYSVQTGGKVRHS